MLKIYKFTTNIPTDSLNDNIINNYRSKDCPHFGFEAIAQLITRLTGNMKVWIRTYSVNRKQQSGVKCHSVLDMKFFALALLALLEATLVLYYFTGILC